MKKETQNESERNNDAMNVVSDAADKAVEKIANAADKASSAIASAALDANRLLASQATSAAKVVDVKHGDDHDFMLNFTSEFKTKLDFLIAQVKELKDNNTARINQLEIEKVNCRDSYPALYKKDVEERLSDHEKRIKYGEITDTRLIAYGLSLLFVFSFAQWLIGKYF